MNRTTTLKLLRNFGSTFSNVQMGYSNGDPQFLICLEWYLAEYCLKSLREITLYAIKPDRAAAFEATGIQLPNIETIFTRNCFFAQNFSFNVNFPNLQTLSLKQARCQFNIKDWHFPTVKKLYFDCYRCERGYDMNDLIEMFKRQPQLEKLELILAHYKFSPNLAKCFNEFLPRLQSLTLRFLKIIPKYFEPVHLEHITDFDLKLEFLRPHQNIPFTFNRLEHIKISLFMVLYTHPDSAALISEFILKNKHLKTIHVKGIRGNFQQLFQFENVLSNVEELSICSFENVPSDIVDIFLKQSQSLKLLRICGIDGNTDALESKNCQKIPHIRWNRRLEKVLEFIFRL